MTIKELRDIIQKGEPEPYWISRYLVRKISIYVTFIFLKLKITATQTTTISALFALAGSVVLVPDLPYRFIISSTCIFIFILLDHVDGEIARYNIKQKKSESDTINISGIYFDQIIHYYQGASFYFCLGAGLAFSQSGMIWFWLGLVAALGSCGFPRFVGCFNILNAVESDRSDRFFDYVEKNSKFNVVHFPGDKKQTRKIPLPRDFSDLVLYGRQLLGFPGNISIFIILTVIHLFLNDNNLVLFKSYILFYSVILLGNTLYSFVKYYKILGKIPK